MTNSIISGGIFLNNLPNPSLSLESNKLKYLSLFRFLKSASHGRSLFIKYINIYPKEIRSSLLLDSFPLTTLKEAYLKVPLNFFVYFGSICFPVLEERYFLHSPKSTTYMTFGSFIPIKKFSGLTSLYIISLECIHSNLSNNCIPMKHASVISHNILLLIYIKNKDLSNKVSIKILYFFV